MICNREFDVIRGTKKRAFSSVGIIQSWKSPFNVMHQTSISFSSCGAISAGKIIFRAPFHTSAISGKRTNFRSNSKCVKKVRFGYPKNEIL